MPRLLKNSRIGVYECSIANGCVTKGRYICGYYIGMFTWDHFISEIIPDLRQYRLTGSEYPILITSWRLQEGDPSKPIPMPVLPQKLTIKSAGGLRNSKKMLGLPVRRKKNPSTETWEAVVDHTGRVIKVVGQRLADQG